MDTSPPLLIFKTGGIDLTCDAALFQIYPAS
jgi:hypothetical protein